MDPFTIIVMLLVAFLAWNMNLMWLFYIIMGIVIVTSRSWAIAIVLVLSLGALYFFKLQDYFLVFFVVIIGVVLVITQRKGGKGASEAYSPELMRLLGGV